MRARLVAILAHRKCVKATYIESDDGEAHRSLAVTVPRQRDWEIPTRGDLPAPAGPGLSPMLTLVGARTPRPGLPEPYVSFIAIMAIIAINALPLCVASAIFQSC